jgi:hypothetical protein
VAFFILQSGKESAALTTIRAIHPAEDANVAFMAKDARGKMFTVGGCAVADLEKHAGPLEALFDGEFYFSINSVGLGAMLPNGLRFALRSYVRTLNAVYVDLDCHRVGIEPEAALQNVWDEVCEGRLPQPSATVKSGQGVYVLWLLRDDTSDTPPAATALSIENHGTVCTTIVDRLKHLGADDSPTDAARVFRVPESLNLESGNRVEWNFCRDIDGSIFTHSLDYLAQYFGTSQAIERETYGRPIKAPGTAPKRVAGAIAKHRYCVIDIEKIERSRGGIKQGSRWFTLSRYAQILRGAKLAKAEVSERVEAMAARCIPPFPSDAGDGTTAQIVATAFEGSIVNASRESLIRLFQVSEDEARSLKLKTIVPETIRTERESEVEANSPKARRLHREMAIKAHFDANPTDSAAEVLKALESIGIETSAATIAREMARLYPNRGKRVSRIKPAPVEALRPRQAEETSDSLSLSKQNDKVKFEEDFQTMEIPSTDFDLCLRTLLLLPPTPSQDFTRKPSLPVLLPPSRRLDYQPEAWKHQPP